MGSEFKNLGNIRTYIMKALKFYDLKQQYLTQIIFTLILFTSFAGTFIPRADKLVSFSDFIYNMILIIVVNLAVAIYLSAYLKELKGNKYTTRECIKQVVGKASLIILASFLYSLGVFIGMLLFIVPSIIISLMFLFYLCFIIDKDKGFMDSFKLSYELSKGIKLQIFVIFLVFIVIMFIPSFILISIAMMLQNDLVLVFVMYFIATVINLIQQRLVALIYIDLKYTDKTDE